MKYKEMIVWSSGDKNATTSKIDVFCCSIAFIMLCVLHILFFTTNLHDDYNISMTLIEHFLYGLFGIGVLGWLTVLMLFGVRDSLQKIKMNKQISLFLYTIEEFATIGKIPEDKFVLFSDKNGVVLALKEYEKESRAFCFGVNDFYKFEEYYNKYFNCKNEMVV